MKVGRIRNPGRYTVIPDPKRWNLQVYALALRYDRIIGADMFTQ
jgi:hypothetical protein